MTPRLCALAFAVLCSCASHNSQVNVTVGLGVKANTEEEKGKGGKDSDHEKLGDDLRRIQEHQQQQFERLQQRRPDDGKSGP